MNNFLQNEIKDRIRKSLQAEYLGYVANKEELEKENKEALEFFSNEDNLIAVTDKLIENAKLECQNSGQIPGNKEILSKVDQTKARSFAIDYFKS